MITGDGSLLAVEGESRIAARASCEYETELGVVREGELADHLRSLRHPDLYWEIAVYCETQ
jgi:hypothetical protein